MWLIDQSVERALIRMAANPTTREAAIEVLFLARRNYFPTGFFDPPRLHDNSDGALHPLVAPASSGMSAETSVAASAHLVDDGDGVCGDCAWCQENDETECIAPNHPKCAWCGHCVGRWASHPVSTTKVRP